RRRLLPDRPRHRQARAPGLPLGGRVRAPGLLGRPGVGLVLRAGRRKRVSQRAVAAAVLLACIALAPAPATAGTLTGTVLTKPVARTKAPPRYYLGPYRSGRGPSVVEE